MERISKADVDPVRQQTQYTCMSCSVSMCFKALGLNLDEDAVNSVLKATPMQGASWEDALQTAQHFGVRATLISPATLELVKKATDKGDPVVISWSPEGNPWSHASVIFDVKGGNVYIADPNMPNPNKTVRVVPEDEFYSNWVEKGPSFNFRRPALILSREITKDGKHVMANLETSWGPMLGCHKLAATKKTITALEVEYSNWVNGKLDAHDYVVEFEKQKQAYSGLPTESSKVGEVINPQVDKMLPDSVRKDLENAKEAASGLPGADNDPVHFREYEPGKKVDEGYAPGEVKKAGHICNRALQRFARVAFRETCRGLRQHKNAEEMWERRQGEHLVFKTLFETSQTLKKLGEVNPAMVTELKKKASGLNSHHDAGGMLMGMCSVIAEKLVLDCKDELPGLHIALEIKCKKSAAAEFLRQAVLAQTPDLQVQWADASPSGIRHEGLM